MADEAVAAEGTAAVGSTAPVESTAAPVGDAGQGEASTTGATGDTQAAEGAAEEPVRYTVKIGGKEEQVTLDEALNSYMRQSDYTRKTQELAAERQRLAQLDALAVALERNPQATLIALATSLGVQVGQPARQENLEELEPEERRWREVQQYMQTSEQRRMAEEAQRAQEAQKAATAAQIDRDLAHLHSQVGDFDNETLLQYAVDHQILNLDAAWRAWQFDVREEQRIKEQNKIIEQKRKAQVVEGGTSSAPGATAPSSGGRMSLREAFKAAIAQQR